MDPKEKKKSKCNRKVIYIEIVQAQFFLMIYINKNLFSHVKVLTASHHIASKMETKHPIQMTEWKWLTIQKNRINSANTEF